MTKSEKLLIGISLLLILYGVVQIFQGPPLIKECQEIGRDVICETEFTDVN